MIRKIFSRNKKIIFLNLFTVGLILFLPYYIFGGKLFIGGDDTRLYYIFPLEWIKNIAFFSWFNFSSVGTYNPNQFIIPILVLLTILKHFLQNFVVIDYLIFSSVLIFGLVSFQLLISEIVSLNDDRSKFISFLGALFYIFSPILGVIQLSSFLYSVWLIGLIPLITYLFIKYLKSGNIKYVFYITVFCIIFSIAMWSVPWILGYIFCISIGLIASIFFNSRSNIFIFLKRSIIFFGAIILSQAFWLLSFLLSFLISDKSSFGSSILLDSSTNIFVDTVLNTASGNIIYPLLDLFHRQIALDFNWSLKNVFFRFYDKTFILNLFFPSILFAGLIYFKRNLQSIEKKVFSIYLVAFLFSLFLFTANIGFLKSVFLSLGRIPGFIMFGNFYDKFNLAYILLYSIVLTISLIAINRKIKNKNISSIINIVFLFLIILNALPLKDLVNTPIWTTNNIYTNVTIPKEYTNFMDKVKKTVDPTSNILSLPINIAGYSLIKDEDSNNIFAGRSPVQLFTKINDFSGDLSFSQLDANRLIDDIVNRKYEDLNLFIFQHNINYVYLIKDIPKEMTATYLYDKNVFSYQDKSLIDAITSKKLFTSEKGNYVLYETNNHSPILQSKDITFQKISTVKYKVHVKNLNDLKDLIFLDSYNSGWKLFLEPYSDFEDCKKVYEDKAKHIVECRGETVYFDLADLRYSFSSPIFDSFHRDVFSFANSWSIDPGKIKSNFPKKYYKENSDGSINVELILYFQPQNYFYLGTIISILTMVFLCSYLFWKRKR